MVYENRNTKKTDPFGSFTKVDFGANSTPASHSMMNSMTSQVDLRQIKENENSIASYRDRMLKGEKQYPHLGVDVSEIMSYGTVQQASYRDVAPSVV